MFWLQDIANEGPVLLARSIHTAIGAFLFSLSKIFMNKPLQEYVFGVMERRKKDHQVKKKGDV